MKRSKKIINVAVVGCGYWGPNLIRNFNSLPEASVKLICDVNENRLKRMKELYPNINVSTDFNTIISDKDVDAVVVATPVYLHYEFAQKSLEAGKHVLIEKPMARSVKECKTLINTAEKNDLTLMLGHTFIYTSAVRKIKEIIDSGTIGQIQYISARRLNLGLFQKDINVAWDLAPHDISIIVYLLGKMPESVNCQGKANIAPGIEDVTNMTINFSEGGFAMIQSSWLDPNKIRSMTIVGSNKMIVYDDNQPLEKIKIYDKRVEVPPYYDTFAEFTYSYHYGDVNSPYIKQSEPLKSECRHFIDCVYTGNQPDSSGIEGLRIVQILEASDKSLKNGGQKVEIKS